MAKLWSSTERANRLATVSLSLVFFLMFAGTARSENYRPWAGDFLRMGVGARALGMGNAYTAVPGDIYSAYYNPSGLAFLDGRQFTVSHRYMSMDRHFTHAAFGTRIGPDADFALSWIGAGTDDIQGRDLNGNRTGKIEDSRNSFAVTFARMFNRKVSAGLNAKLSLWKLGDEDAKAVGFDAGVTVKPVESVSLALVARDINSRFTWNSDRWGDVLGGIDGQPNEKEDKLPLYITAGASWRPIGDPLLLSFAVESVEDYPLGYDFGASYTYDRMLTIRGGIYNYTASDGLDYGAVTAGFGVQVTGTIGLDYAYATDMVEDDRIHVISLTLGYGE